MLLARINPLRGKSNIDQVCRKRAYRLHAIEIVDRNAASFIVEVAQSHTGKLQYPLAHSGMQKTDSDNSSMARASRLDGFKRLGGLQ